MREKHERRDQRDRQPDGGLAGRVKRLPDDRDEPRRSCAHCEECRADRDRAEHDEEHELRARAVHAGEEHRHDRDRPELAGDARAEHGRTERRRQDPRVAEDRHQSAQRRRRNGEAEQPALGAETRELQEIADADPERDRDHPPERAADDRAARNVLLDHLEPREEEQERQAEVREELEVRALRRPVEHLGAEQDAEDDLDDDGREHEVRTDAREECRGRSRDQHEDERLQLVRGDGLRGFAEEEGAHPRLIRSLAAPSWSRTVSRSRRRVRAP